MKFINYTADNECYDKQNFISPFYTFRVLNIRIKVIVSNLEIVCHNMRINNNLCLFLIYTIAINPPL